MKKSVVAALSLFALMSSDVVAKAKKDAAEEDAASGTNLQKVVDDALLRVKEVDAFLQERSKGLKIGERRAIEASVDAVNRHLCDLSKNCGVKGVPENCKLSHPSAAVGMCKLREKKMDLREIRVQLKILEMKAGRIKKTEAAEAAPLKKIEEEKKKAEKLKKQSSS